MSSDHGEILNLSRDIGKVSERTGRLEEGFIRFEKKIDTFMEESKRRADTREERDKLIAIHMAKVCAFAKLAIFLTKWVVPPGGLVAILVGGRTMGWW